jgi:hypothetical protein
LSAMHNPKKTIMKKIGFLSLMFLAFTAVNAQNYNEIKTKLTLNQLPQAKADLDKNWSNPKFTAKAEAYMLKTAIYAAMAVDEATSKTPQADVYLNEAAAAFTKYREMDPKLEIVDDPIYQNGPINLYSGLYSSGYADFQAKAWEKSYQKFTRAYDISTFLLDRKILQGTIDTNVLIMAGITAENSNKKEDAAKFYSKLAENKITGEGFESVYRFLVSYYFERNDIANFEKYKALGLEMYPKSDFFTFDKVDFAVGLAPNFNEKLKAVEDVLATDPNNFKATEVLGEIIYDTLNVRGEDAPVHSNEAELEKKMVAAFAKAAELEPKNELPLIYTGDHFINKAVRVNKEREAHGTAMKARTKPGTMASKEDIATRDALDKRYGEALESARLPYEKVAVLYAAKPKSEDANQALRDKTQYKKIASYLADIYAFKKAQAKVAADKTKFAAEEKKWNDLWDSIK